MTGVLGGWQLWTALLAVKRLERKLAVLQFRAGFQERVRGGRLPAVMS